MAEKAIPLRRAYAKFSKKRLGYKPKRKSWANERLQVASIHSLPKDCAIFRVDEDEIVVTDGGYGYTPFKLSELQLMLKEAKKLPIQSEFRVDSLA